MNVNTVIVGHIDHGKSTLIGRLLYDSETLTGDRVAEMQKLIEEYKKRFEFAYFLDSFEEELKEERTIDTTRVLFKGKNYYTIVDVPGHQEFVKNMLTGACHAQVAILVVSAPDGVQEQTRRHAFLLKMLGIKDVLVAVNKMDLMDYRQVDFEKTKEETARFLKSIGYNASHFVPVSAMEGDNVFKPSVRMDWYKDPTLIQALDGIELEEESRKPLRFVVQDTYDTDSGRVTVGRVEVGLLKKGDDIIFQPAGVKGSVQKIIVFPEELDSACAGDSIGVLMDAEVERGNVGGHLEQPPVPTESFLGEVVLLEGTLEKDDCFEVKCGAKKVDCRVKQIKERISSETGIVIEENPVSIGEREAAIVVLETPPLVVERFSDIAELGRFILVREGKNIGAGIVLEPQA
ncbi:GTP-binding protein [Chloroflexota bacterium]